MKTIEQHAQEIAKKFIGYKLTGLKWTGDNPAYALCIQFYGGIGGHENLLNIEFWMEKEMLQYRIEDALIRCKLDQLTIIKIDGDEYRTLNVRVEVVE